MKMCSLRMNLQKSEKQTWRVKIQGGEDAGNEQMYVPYNGFYFIISSSMECWVSTTPPAAFLSKSLYCSFQIIISDRGSPVATKPPLNFPLPNFTLRREQVCHVIVLARDILPKKSYKSSWLCFQRICFPLESIGLRRV